MFPKAVIGLFLALVFQLAQVAPCLAVYCAPAPREAKCGCCDGPDSCPCASNQKEHERSTPIAPPVQELKVQLALPSLDPVAPAMVLTGAATPRGSPADSRDPAAGYAGVPLAVAFCSFLI